jgi:hypothetical protein
MNVKKVCLWATLICFSVFSAGAMWELGYVGIWQAGIDSSGSLQILLDLVICCFIISCWIKTDCQLRGVSPYPWFIAILSTGSLAILVYLIVREHQQSNTPALQTS